ncbi:MarR family transcriptional regulator [Pseudoflavitalea sp. X16]|jgi:DNA-binding MarR family transcriptional regulator|uniref:MarR family winged helix-turn-helix transcriptional regulator n=1 Tax=Paraflavitalea devenefica TaxID=2716334 RepID=UPI0014232738|nr:MarR family transcriptional regulator [Paraflavitalea devenefica]NII24983.1 MarR family transcriptional regulator [Paraflavitalea devenefica]
MSSFNPEQHLININSKIIASLEKISEVFRVLLQAQAQGHGLSSTQLQLLLFIKYHPAPHQRKAAFMAKEFNVTKATISDSVKALEQKQLIQRITDPQDSRSFILSLTGKGQELAAATENFTMPLDHAVDSLSVDQKEYLLYSVFDLIYRLNQTGIISTQRMCYNCHYYNGNRRDDHYCNLVKQPLTIGDLRLECPEFTKP